MSRLSGLIRMMALTVVLPLLTVQLGLQAGWTPLIALSVAAVFPFADTVYTIVRSRSASIMGLVSLLTIVIGIGLSFVTGDALFAILKDSVFTLVFSVIFFGSLATAKPLIYQLNRQMLDPAGAATLDAAYAERPAVRRVFVNMTIGWGAGLLLEAVLRVVAALTLPIRLATLASPWITFFCIGGLTVWTIVYARARQAAARRAGRPVV